ncbi:MAG: Rrf2 family transcriptional regulator [Acidobacteria bacterium]|nr:Rrf2 family transcriptional regulator [Acidobacteriota bacterium]MCB9396179.1 Rrf2 family transcriptional regulator [Acidobacteriota bacterium]
MLRIPKSVDYGVLILLTLFESEDQMLSAKEIATRCGVSYQQVAKLLKMLVKNALVHSKQGAQGGYSLSPEKANLNLEEIYQALEGPFSFAECMDKHVAGSNGCKVDPTCRLKPHLAIINQAIQSVCRSLTLKDISRSRHRKPELPFPLGVAL